MESTLKLKTEICHVRLLIRHRLQPLSPVFPAISFLRSAINTITDHNITLPHLLTTKTDVLMPAVKYSDSGQLAATDTAHESHKLL